MGPRQLTDALYQYARNRHVGTCVDCPRGGGMTFPEFCKHKNRYDHTLGAESLCEMIASENKHRRSLYDEREEMCHFLENTLIPDLMDSGTEATAETFKACVRLLRLIPESEHTHNPAQAADTQLD